MAAKNKSTTTLIPNPIELARQAWKIYQKRFWSIVGIYLVGSLITFVATILVVIVGVIWFFLSGGKDIRFTLDPAEITKDLVVFLPPLLLFVIALSIVGTWVDGAKLILLNHWNKEMGIKQSFKLAKPFILPLFLTSFLYGLVIFGSMWILIVPAFIFSVWFSFYQYVVVIDGKTGLQALHTSREYIRGRFWGVIGRVIAIRLPEFILSIIVTSIVQKTNLDELGILFQFLALLLIPFYQMYSYSLFMQLRKTTDLKEVSLTTKTKVSYLVIPILGLLLIISSIVVLAPIALRALVSLATNLVDYQNRGTLADGTKSGTQIVAGLVMYQIANEKFPKDLNVLVEDKILPEIPVSVSGGSYEYSVAPDGKDFRLCTPVEMSPQKCVTSKSTSFDL